MSHEVARIFHVFPRACGPPYVRDAVGSLKIRREAVPSQNKCSKRTSPKIRRFHYGLPPKGTQNPRRGTPDGSRGLLAFPMEQNRHWKIKKQQQRYRS
ncbi:hypothetical protein Zmor_018537 [Zophobas morio]|uniref:Uncharacterized protein n=1 Tax=Zophobas morio TaxID=2755281 RepID=A0AA38IBS3_9CUCU|nr:hypothetical protein Zmor_018537 [Zophobas morio]